MKLAQLKKINVNQTVRENGVKFKSSQRNFLYPGDLIMLRAITILAMVVPSLVSANGYPTAETVRMVVTCMAEIGGQNEENLFACSCRQDLLESELTFAAYERASLHERYVAMPGKRGNLFRDSETGREYVRQLKAVRETATTACPVIKKVTRDTAK